MRNVTVIDFSVVGYKQILSAEKGIFDRQESAWIFTNGKLITLDESGKTTTIGFKKYLSVSYTHLTLPTNLCV